MDVGAARGRGRHPHVRHTQLFHEDGQPQRFAGSGDFRVSTYSTTTPSGDVVCRIGCSCGGGETLRGSASNTVGEAEIRFNPPAQVSVRRLNTQLG